MLRELALRCLVRPATVADARILQTFRRTREELSDEEVGCISRLQYERAAERSAQLAVPTIVITDRSEAAIRSVSLLLTSRVEPVAFELHELPYAAVNVEDCTERHHQDEEEQRYDHRRDREAILERGPLRGPSVSVRIGVSHVGLLLN